MFFHVEHSDQWFWYDGFPDYALGTSLCYTREFWKAHRFRSPVDTPLWGEDNEFVRAARNLGELVSVPADSMMWARIHAGNTSIKDVGGAQTQYRPIPAARVPQEFGIWSHSQSE
jgi:hypothetical protein